MESAGRPRSSPAAIATAALIGGIAGIASGAGVSWYLSYERLDTASVRPPVAVVDFATLVARDGTSRSAAEIDRQVLQVKSAVRKLRDNGFLVLDSQAVLGAPEVLYVPVDRLD